MSTLIGNKKFLPLFLLNYAPTKPVVLNNKTARTLILLVAFAIAPYLLPGAERYRVLLPEKLALALRLQKPAPAIDHNFENATETVQIENSFSTEPIDSFAVESNGKTAQIGTSATQIKIEKLPGKIEDPSGHALDHFFAALAKAESGKAVVKISHYGDSPITNDGITSTVRRRLQEKFGDAGHGFVLIDKPWGWYEQVGVNRDASTGWESAPIDNSRSDHRFGFGGASFKTSLPNVTATFSTVKAGQFGDKVSAFDIYYLIQPGGGNFDIEIDGNHHSRVSTAGEQIKSGFQRVELTTGEHAMRLRTVGNGIVRLFGVVLQAGETGVQYDSLGVNGAYISLLANYLDTDHWIEQLRYRQPDLVIIGYGANESQYETLSMKQYERDTKEVIRRLKVALPNTSIMLLGPMDRGTRAAGGAIVTRPMIPKLIDYQRRIAAETGCAFFDTFTAMGGEGTVANWYSARPRLMGGDFTHPTAQGSEIVGTLIYDAITEAYQHHHQQQQ